MAHDLRHGYLKGETHISPEQLLETIVSQLPSLPPPGPLGGRPAIAHHIVLQVAWHALVTGCRWCEIPKSMGCSGETARTRVRDWQQQGLCDRFHQLLLAELR
ncbi:MAG: transposase [Planctomycetales bacterium]|nr:transposase [Planctomycetales bacterium]